MPDLVSRHSAFVEVLTPLHIGTGETLEGLAFVQDRFKVYVLDIDRVTELAATGGGEAEYLLSLLSNRRQGRELLDALTDAVKDVTTISRYVLRKPPGARWLRSILPFVRDVRQRPYVPGSSLKGAVRSAIARGLLVGDHQLYQTVGQGFRKNLESPDGRQLRTLGRKLEANIFGKDPHHDWLRTVSFADSSPSVNNALELYQVEIRSLRGSALGMAQRPDGNKLKNMDPLVAECLSPGSIVSTELSMMDYLTEPTRYTSGREAPRVFGRDPAIDWWIAAVNRGSLDLARNEIEFFRRHREEGTARWLEDLASRIASIPGTRREFYIQLGWGAGYRSKTFALLYPNEFEALRKQLRPRFKVGVPRKADRSKGRVRLIHDFSRALPVEDSPKSRRLVHEGAILLPMGWVRVVLDVEPAQGKDLQSRETADRSSQTSRDGDADETTMEEKLTLLREKFGH